MAHFAKVLDGKVTEVIVAEQEFFDNRVELEPVRWIQTSYNTLGGIHYEPNSNYETPSEDQTKALRKNYAGIGYTYDVDKDAFYAPQPYPSWILNETTCMWKAPVAYPTDGQKYTWNEETTSWDLNE